MVRDVALDAFVPIESPDGGIKVYRLHDDRLRSCAFLIHALMLVGLLNDGRRLIHCLLGRSHGREVVLDDAAPVRRDDVDRVPVPIKEERFAIRPSGGVLASCRRISGHDGSGLTNVTQAIAPKGLPQPDKRPGL